MTQPGGGGRQSPQRGGGQPRAPAGALGDDLCVRRGPALAQGCPGHGRGHGQGVPGHPPRRREVRAAHHGQAAGARHGAARDVAAAQGRHAEGDAVPVGGAQLRGAGRRAPGQVLPAAPVDGAPVRGAGREVGQAHPRRAGGPRVVAKLLGKLQRRLHVRDGVVGGGVAGPPVHRRVGGGRGGGPGHGAEGGGRQARRLRCRAAAPGRRGRVLRRRVAHRVGRGRAGHRRLGAGDPRGRGGHVGRAPGGAQGAVQDGQPVGRGGRQCGPRHGPGPGPRAAEPDGCDAPLRLRSPLRVHPLRVESSRGRPVPGQARRGAGPPRRAEGGGTGVPVGGGGHEGRAGAAQVLGERGGERGTDGRVGSQEEWTPHSECDERSPRSDEDVLRPPRGGTCGGARQRDKH